MRDTLSNAELALSRSFDFERGFNNARRLSILLRKLTIQLTA
jgi:hypothetical protein